MSVRDSDTHENRTTKLNLYASLAKKLHILTLKPGLIIHKQKELL